MKFLLKVVIGAVLIEVVRSRYDTFIGGYLVGAVHMSMVTIIDMVSENTNDKT